MLTFGLLVLLVLNFAISWFNAWATGMGWVESKLSGFVPRLMAWCGAIMSACGFTWVYVTVTALIAHYVGIAVHHPFPDKYVNGMVSLGYLAIIIPIIGSGLAITLDAWATFWRKRNVVNGVVAGYDTFAQIANMVGAVREIPNAFGAVFGMFKSDDDDNGSGILIAFVFAAVIAAITGGILTTRKIILDTARNQYYTHYKFTRR